jgi:hypothetical protein
VIGENSSLFRSSVHIFWICRKTNVLICIIAKTAICQSNRNPKGKYKIKHRATRTIIQHHCSKWSVGAYESNASAFISQTTLTFCHLRGYHTTNPQTQTLSLNHPIQEIKVSFLHFIRHKVSLGSLHIINREGLK